MPSTGHDVGAVTEFDEGVPVRVEVGGRALMIVRQGERFFALRDRCAHQGAALSGGKVGATTLPCRPGEKMCLGREGEIVTCPWHGWEYDLTSGRTLTDPHQARVATYSVSLKDDRVFVNL